MHKLANIYFLSAAYFFRLEIKDMYGFCEYVVNAFKQLPFEKNFDKFVCWF